MARGNGSNGHNLIELHDVHKAYETSAGEITVLHDIDLRVKSNTVRFSQLEMQVVVRIIEEISQRYPGAMSIGVYQIVFLQCFPEAGADL